MEAPVVMVIESTRFGPVEIDPDTIIEFPDGLIGLAGSRFALLTSDPGGSIMWLHCVDDPSLSLPVTEPHRFFSDFSVSLTDDDADRLGLDDSAGVDVYVTVVAAPELRDFTANTKAPILVRSGQGHQIINQAPNSDLRALLFADVLDAEGQLGGSEPAAG
jgi:flagellar assembly factor FliW